MNHRLAYLLLNTAVILGDLTAPIFADPSMSQEAGIVVGYDASKASKNSKSSKAASSAVNIKPFKCTNQCIDARVGLDNSTKLLTDAIVECDAQEEGQEWIIHQEGNNIVRMESVVYPGQCIAVEHDHYVRNATTGEIQVVDFQGVSYPYERKGTLTYLGVALDTNTTIDACTDGVVGLISCDCESTKWYSTGGQLLSLTCWKADFSTSLSVGYDDSGACLPDVKSLVDSGTWDSTFMFIEAGSLAGLGMVGAFVSDIRLKRNINLIGKSPSGIPTYTFKYREGIKLANNDVLDSKSTFVGAMAQDLLELAPDAVIMGKEDGYYRVDYSKIDVDFYKL